MPICYCQKISIFYLFKDSHSIFHDKLSSVAWIVFKKPFANLGMNSAHINYAYGNCVN